MSNPNPSELCVWALDLDPYTDRLSRLERLLTADELERAWRYRDPQDRARFIAARGMLREILADCLSSDPRAIRFSRSPSSKPELSGESAPGGLKFNTTRSGSLGLVALRWQSEVGIDVERLRPLAGIPSLLDRLLAPEERAEFPELSPEALEERFFETWVRKEAVTKMIGRGLGQPLGELSLHPWQRRGARGIELPPGLGSSRAWLLPLDLPLPGFVAAVATDAAVGGVQLSNWTPVQATRGTT